MNLLVHSGPTECRMEGSVFRCPCTDGYINSPFEIFQLFQKIFQNFSRSRLPGPQLKNVPRKGEGSGSLESFSKRTRSGGLDSLGGKGDNPCR